MRESPTLLPIALTLMIAWMLPQILGPGFFRRAAIRAGHLHQFMSWRHEAVSAYDDSIKYDGRWLTTLDQCYKAASFGGSTFEFSVFNTSSVNLELANEALGVQSENPKPDSTSLVLTPTKSTPATEGPVSFFHTVNGSTNATYHHKIDTIVTLAYKLDRNAVYTFKVTLPYYNNGSTLQLRNLWIERGGQLLHSRAPKDEVVMATNNSTKEKTTILLEDREIPERKLVEIMAPVSYLSYACPSTTPISSSASWAVNWPTLLQENFHDSTVSTLDISSSSCLTSRCKKATIKPQHIFFRSGPPNTTLHKYLWSFTHTTSTPGALVLMLGLSDVEHLLTTTNPGKHTLTSFTEELSHEYSSFVQTIRRTAYSPSSLANIRSRSRGPSNPDSEQQMLLDESHLYNSAPSTLPIFLVLPPIPSTLLLPHSRQIKSILHHVTTKVLDNLKWHIGDRKTVIIDTAGWLNDADFTQCGREDPLPVSASDFVLNQSGHVKFAYHLSLHLCPYMGGKECSFEKHSEYGGNLVVPEVESIGRKMEEKRVEKIHEMFGI